MKMNTRVRLQDNAHQRLWGIIQHDILRLSRKTEFLLEAIWGRTTSKTFFVKFGVINDDLPYASTWLAVWFPTNVLLASSWPNYNNRTKSNKVHRQAGEENVLLLVRPKISLHPNSVFLEGFQMTLSLIPEGRWKKYFYIALKSQSTGEGLCPSDSGQIQSAWWLPARVLHLFLPSQNAKILG